MNDNHNPLFEAYVSVDIENPLNADIYKLRDELSDKKMTAMPVDIPLFGHFDGNMTLIRHFSELNELMTNVLSQLEKIDFKDDDYTLKSDHYEVTAEGQLFLVMQHNEIISALMKLILSEAEDRDMSMILSLESVQSFKKNA